MAEPTLNLDYAAERYALRNLLLAATEGSGAGLDDLIAGAGRLGGRPGLDRAAYERALRWVFGANPREALAVAETAVTGG